MDLIDDKILDNSAGEGKKAGRGSMGNKPVELPLSIEYVEFKADESAATAVEAPSSNKARVDRSDPRYADLPPDATLVEYKIPPAPPVYRSQAVEDMRQYA